MSAKMTDKRLREIERVLLETREHLMDTEEATILECVREIRRLQATEGVNWKSIFVKYANAVGEAEGVDYFYYCECTHEEKAAIESELHVPGALEINLDGKPARELNRFP